MRDERVSWIQSNPQSRGVHYDLITMHGSLDSELNDGTVLVRPDYNRNLLILMRDPRPTAAHPRRKLAPKKAARQRRRK